jgi:fatty acid desaturase
MRQEQEQELQSRMQDQVCPVLPCVVFVVCLWAVVSLALRYIPWPLSELLGMCLCLPCHTVDANCNDRFTNSRGLLL